MIKKGLRYAGRTAVKLGHALQKIGGANMHPVPGPPLAETARNADLEGRFEGDTCYVIGCGPSLSTTDLKKLGDGKVIALSTLFYHGDYQKLNVVANVYTGYSYHHYNLDKPTIEKYYDEVEKHSKGTLFFEKRDVEFITGCGFFKDKDLRYYHAIPDREYFDYYPPSIVNAIYEGQNVAIFGIQVAMSLGFKNIYLLGLDHTWMKQLDEKSYTRFKTEKDVLYNQSGKTDFDVDGQNTFAFWLNVYHKLWNDYRDIEKMADKTGVSIVNLTKGSMLDLFPKEDFEQHVSEHQNNTVR